MRGSEVIRLSVFFDHILQAEEQTGKHIPELLAEVKKAGISAVEINCTYLLEHPATLEMLETAGLQVSCIYEFYALERGRETEKARRHIEIAKKNESRKNTDCARLFFSGNGRVCELCAGQGESVGLPFPQ